MRGAYVSEPPVPSNPGSLIHTGLESARKAAPTPTDAGRAQGVRGTSLGGESRGQVTKASRPREKQRGED